MRRPLSRHLARHGSLFAVLAASLLIGLLAAAINASGDIEIGAATTQVQVDYPDEPIVSRSALTQDVDTLQKRAELYSRLLVTTPVLERVARHAGIPPEQLSGVARTTADVTIALLEPRSEERASQILDSRLPYRLEMQAEPGEPIFSVYAEAPSEPAARALADAAVLGLRDHLRALAREQDFDVRDLPRLAQLGEPRGGIVNGSARMIIGALTFITASGLSLALLLLLRRGLRRRRVPDGLPLEPLVAPRPPSLRAAADWPRTTRVLPWAIAALITMIWLTPFDKIQLMVPSPVEITLDRLVLPMVAVVWALAFFAGPWAAPRLRLTRVHLAVGAALACAFISVVLDARWLNQTGELMLAFKKLPLLVSYMSIFLLVSSAVRRTEVAAYMKYTFVLSVIVAAGVIYEYRFNQNVFIMLANAVFKGPFSLISDGGDSDGSGFDSQGRRWVQGPTRYGVELIAMLTIALPIGVVGLLQSRTTGRRMLYGLAIVIIAAAMFSTSRKSAMIAPAAAMLTLAYFRRRELLSLAPLAVVLPVMVAVLSPGAAQGVLQQFTRSDASQLATVSDRTADYDAIRPDVWTHLLFGRGHGTYVPTTYRILDSEILGRLVETGVAGLVAFLLIPITVILVARRTASSRDPRWSPSALYGVAASVSFIVVAFLYDVMSVPHAPDTFLYVVALAVVAAIPDDRPAPPAARPAPVPLRTRSPAAERARAPRALV